MDNTGGNSFSDIEDLTFEQAFEELGKIVNQLEGGALQLENSVTLFERGRALSAHCQSVLDKAELRVNRLTGDSEIEPLD